MSDNESTTGDRKAGPLLASLATQTMWHLFGGLATVAFMVAASSLVMENSTLSDVPVWAWILISIAGFASMLRYARWIQVQRAARARRSRLSG